MEKLMYAVPAPVWLKAPENYKKGPREYQKNEHPSSQKTPGIPLLGGHRAVELLGVRQRRDGDLGLIRLRQLRNGRANCLRLGAELVQALPEFFRRLKAARRMLCYSLQYDVAQLGRHLWVHHAGRQRDRIHMG